MPTIEINLPPLYPKQREAIYCDERYVWIAASTKSGKTAGCIVWQLDRCFSDNKGMEHWWVAPVYQQSKIAFRRARRMLVEAGLQDHISSNKSELTITFPNDARWCFKSADKPDNLYGEDVADAVLDEASRMKESSWFAVRSTLTATRGPVRGIGNVKGRKNWFYRMCESARQGREGHRFFKLTAWDAVDGGILDEQEIIDARDSLPEHVFRELYLAEPSDDGNNPFGQQSILDCVAPMSTAAPVVWGWDLAKSVDWTVGIALDSSGAVCRMHRFQRPWQKTIETMKAVTKCPALVDSTGVGDPVVEQLPGRFRGFKFTRGSKQQIMERLAVAIQSGEIAYPEGDLLDELLTFEYSHYRGGVRYEAPTGLHDDCVCALALAVRLFDSTAIRVHTGPSKPRKLRTHRTIDIGL